jgi:hypothetical protein
VAARIRLILFNGCIKTEGSLPAVKQVFQVALFGKGYLKNLLESRFGKSGLRPVPGIQPVLRLLTGFPVNTLAGVGLRPIGNFGGETFAADIETGGRTQYARPTGNIDLAVVVENEIRSGEKMGIHGRTPVIR